MSIKDGGPAFPITKDAVLYQCKGMTLRDWFAGKALCSIAGVCLKQGSYGTNNFEFHIAKTAYILADAMLAEREKEAKDGK